VIKLRSKIAVIFLVFVVVTGARAKDVFFESSDGVWSDFTNDLKGRDFYAVLWTFEHYKMKQNMSDVTLVRITPEPKNDRKWSKEDREDPKWKVVIGTSSGHARAYFAPNARGETEEVKKRADAASAFWRNK